MEKFKPRASQWNQVKDSRSGARVKKLEKEKVASPSPVTYNTYDAFYKTQYVEKYARFSKEKNTNFVDKEVKKRSKVPGVGHYNPDKSFDKANYKSLFLRSKRC